MNTAYSEELRPPKELFSREWFHIWNEENNSFHVRIDETKKKLENLEVKLRKKIWGSGGYKQDLLVDTVTMLGTYVGVWKTNIVNNHGLSVGMEFRLIYPRNNTTEMLTWEEIEFGGLGRGAVKEGVYIFMLSPESVEWLNRISHWVSE